MIHKIANLLRDEIKDLDFVDIAVGIAKPTIVKVPTEDGSIEKRVPMALRDVTDPCDPHELYRLVPDTTKLSIHWWEDNGIDLTDENTYYYFSRASLRLISWWNLKKISSVLTDASPLVANLISNIPDNLDNTDYITQIQVRFAGTEPEGANLVSQYNFDEGENQFTTFPYVFTGMNYEIDFAFTKNCVDAVILNPDICT